MARPLRIEYPGALYHITSRGNAWIDIFHDKKDREFFHELSIGVKSLLLTNLKSKSGLD